MSWSKTPPKLTPRQARLRKWNRGHIIKRGYDLARKRGPVKACKGNMGEHNSFIPKFKTPGRGRVSAFDLYLIGVAGCDLGKTPMGEMIG